ncbi:hypothetical protein [Amycolatopsis echigonensis]|uniref:Uncharacterized protein n=1 Tax=Amycolatopsis echigonensis TaxID=2576905 RepID=A0A8E1W3N2_9PSEU|nr:hypothetical protein [Amycolatopsis echigonensis]MBB2503347.1 hypothetical protein [Amycolatopsis echigonensis]
MGNEDNSTGSTLKNTAKGAAVGAAYGAVLGPEGAVVGGVVGGLVGAASSIFSGGPHADHLQANVGGGSIDAYTIYDKISKGNTSSLDGGRSAADTLQKLHAARSQQIDALNNKMNSAWQGSSAGAAQSGANALKIWHDDSAKNLGTSQTFMTNQVDAFHDVHGKVQELPKDPPEMKWYDHQPFSDKDDEIDKYNQNSQTNVQAYTAYYGSSSQNAGGMPQYNVWQGNNISDGNTDPGKYGGGPGTGPGGIGGGFSGGPGGVGGGSFTPPKTNPPRFTPPGGGGGFTPPKTNPPRFTPPGGPGGPGQFVPPDDGTKTSGWTPPTTDPAKFDPSSFGPTGSGSGYGAGSGGGAGGGAAFGPGGFGGAGFGPGGTGSGAAAGGAGAGAGAGGVGGMRGAGAGTAGKAGAAGMGGMGGGAKGGKGQEDEEHQTKYLLEEDGNDIFGSDQMTVPPVIGE